MDESFFILSYGYYHIRSKKENHMKKLYFRLAFIYWAIWLSIMPTVEENLPPTTILKLFIGYVIYGVTYYYSTMHGELSHVWENARGP